MRHRVRIHTKFVIFVIIGSLLVATMYSSSTRFVFAGNPPKVTDKGAYPLGSDCTKNPDGTYSCTQDQDQDNKDDGLSDKPDSNNSNDNNDNSDR